MELLALSNAPLRRRHRRSKREALEELLASPRARMFTQAEIARRCKPEPQQNNHEKGYERSGEKCHMAQFGGQERAERWHQISCPTIRWPVALKWPSPGAVFWNPRLSRN